MPGQVLVDKNVFDCLDSNLIGQSTLPTRTRFDQMG